MQSILVSTSSLSLRHLLMQSNLCRNVQAEYRCEDYGFISKLPFPYWKFLHNGGAFVQKFYKRFPNQRWIWILLPICRAFLCNVFLVMIAVIGEFRKYQVNNVNRHLFSSCFKLELFNVDWSMGNTVFHIFEGSWNSFNIDLNILRSSLWMSLTVAFDHWQ